MLCTFPNKFFFTSGPPRRERNRLFYLVKLFMHYQQVHVLVLFVVSLSFVSELFETVIACVFCLKGMNCFVQSR